MGINVEITGAGELLDCIENMGLNVDNAVNVGLQEGAKPVLEMAKQNVNTPVLHNRGSKEFLKPLIDTGKLLRSMKISKPKGRKYKYRYISVYTKDPVAHLVEFGHGGPASTPPHPFLAPALESNRAKVQQILKNYLSEAVKNG